MFINIQQEVHRLPTRQSFPPVSSMVAISLILVSCVSAPSVQSLSKPASAKPTTEAIEPGSSSRTLLTDPLTTLTAVVAAIPAGKTLAFTGLSGPGGIKSEIAGNASLKLEPLLVAACRKKGVTLLEREKLLQIIEEWKLEMTGVTQGDQGARELLGADVILTGNVLVQLPDVHIYLKTVNLKDGAVLSAAEVLQPAESYGSAEFETSKSGPAITPGGIGNRATSADGKLSLWTDSGTYTTGDKLKVFFAVAAAAYVTVVDLTPEGKKTIIFPNPYQRDNYCRPGLYQIPPPGASFALEVTGPKGTDRLMAMTSDKPDFDQGVIQARGVKFTADIVNSTTSRASIAFDIR